MCPPAIISLHCCCSCGGIKDRSNRANDTRWFYSIIIASLSLSLILHLFFLSIVMCFDFTLPSILFGFVYVFFFFLSFIFLSFTSFLSPSHALQRFGCSSCRITYSNTKYAKWNRHAAAVAANFRDLLAYTFALQTFLLQTDYDWNDKTDITSMHVCTHKNEKKKSKYIQP